MTDPVSAALARYADRGVFRGYRATPGPRGRIDYTFMWLLRRPMAATFDPRRSVLAFPALFPHVAAGSPLAADLNGLVASRAHREQPAHKRLDARRARVRGGVRRGAWALAFDIRGANHDYTVRHALNLINELYVALHAHYPEYLVEHFGLSTE